MQELVLQRYMPPQVANPNWHMLHVHVHTPTGTCIATWIYFGRHLAGYAEQCRNNTKE